MDPSKKEEQALLLLGAVVCNVWCQHLCSSARLWRDLTHQERVFHSGGSHLSVIPSIRKSSSRRVCRI
ncbi:hypothetical protein D918_03988 [Trichuris suis]|nr:hypothetical protein D918_03988 [Trichuris suis]